MGILFITHDLGVIAEMCDSVLVMYGGSVVEAANVVDLFQNPRHPYTRGLLKSIPRLDHPRKQHLATIEGTVPAPGSLPPGCRFQNRCDYFREACAKSEPPLVSAGPGRMVRCFRAEEI